MINNNLAHLLQMNVEYGDAETTGLSIPFSQWLHICFLNAQTSAVTNIRSAMEWHRLPNMEALIVNGYPLRSLVEENSLYNGIHQVIEYINQNTPSIWVFHNASFDSAVISNSIYQNVASSNLYPFKTNGNILLDSLQLVRAVNAFDGTCGVQFPSDHNGHPIFRLEKLCLENSIGLNAHDAEEDTVALQELVELVKQSSPKIYEIALQCAVKQFSKQKIMDQPYVYAAIGTERNFGIRAITPIAMSEEGSDVIVADLSADLEQLKDYSPLEISGFLGNRVHAKYPIFRLPLNKGITILSQEELPFVLKMTGGWDETELFRKASEFRRDQDLKLTAKEALSWRANSLMKEDPTTEERIYSHFPTQGEKTFINAFNLAEPEDKWQLIEHYSSGLEDDRFIRLARRVVLQNWREYAPPEVVESHTQWCVQRLFSEPMEQEDVHKWETIYSCMNNVSRLRKKYPDKAERIDELEVFYNSIAAGMGIDLSKSFDN